METTFGWRHFHVHSKRRGPGKDWFLEMVSTCDETTRFWLNAKILKVGTSSSQISFKTSDVLSFLRDCLKIIRAIAAFFFQSFTLTSTLDQFLFNIDT